MNKFLLAASAAALFAGASEAAVISADTATASSEFSGAYLAENTIDGSGLSAAGDPSATHADYARFNHWTTGIGTNATDQSITWGFTSAATVGGIYIWNHLSNNISSNSGYEPTLFDLTLLDAGGNQLAFFDDVDLTPDTNLAQAFSFGTTYAGVSSITFDVEAVQSSNNYTGLAEVLFDSSANIAGATDLGGGMAAVPLPAGLPLLLGAFAALFGLRRRAN